MKKIFCLAALLTLVLTLPAGCDLIDYHPYDTRIEGERDINRHNIRRIEEACRGRRSLRFAVISDTQRWYDETKAAVRSINARKDIDFVIHLGDLTDFGVTREFEWMRRELEQLSVPYVCLIGNHDCLGTGADTFLSMYGTPNFTFNAGNTHFVCLNTNAVEYDYTTAIPDFGFLRNDISSLPQETGRTVIAMHAMPYSDQFNHNVAEVFEEYILHYPALQFALAGHNHYTSVHDLFNDGLLYYECGSAKSREYLVFTLTEDGKYEYEVIAC